MIPVAISQIQSQTLTFTLTGLITNKYYKFAVSAVNIVGEGLTAESAPIITATVPGQPGTPSLKSSAKDKIEIMWSDPIDLGGTTLDSYVIEMD